MSIKEKNSRSLVGPVLVVASALALGTLAGIFWVIPTLKAETSQWIEPSRGESLLHGKALYEQHCASCHGSKLQGQPNWQTRMSNGRLPAPPHDNSGHTWHHPDQDLVLMIKNGLEPGVIAPHGYQSDMPAYGDLLSDADIRSIIAYIKTSWGPKELEMQREISEKAQ